MNDCCLISILLAVVRRKQNVQLIFLFPLIAQVLTRTASPSFKCTEFVSEFVPLTNLARLAVLTPNLLQEVFYRHKDGCLLGCCAVYSGRH
jgi:hypothetical protein